MATAAIVDDVKVDQRLAGALLESRTEFQLVYARNGRDALAKMERGVPDVVITDLQMPEMDGLELVEAIRRDYPTVPVILMTAHGSEDVAAQALRQGAAGYVPKRHLAQDLVPTVKRLLALAGKELQEQSVLACLQQTESRFVLSNDPAQIQPLVSYLRKEAARVDFLDATEITRIAVALDEAITNAMLHGNLEATSDLADADITTRHSLWEKRRVMQPYSERKVELTAIHSRSEATYVVRDEGKGFNTSTLPDPRDPANLEKTSGRGLVLIRTFMDDVHHTQVGNEITMIKRAGS